jgi:hypothetical protein
MMFLMIFHDYTMSDAEEQGRWITKLSIVFIFRGCFFVKDKALPDDGDEDHECKYDGATCHAE